MDTQEVFNTKLWKQGVNIDIQNFLARKLYIDNQGNEQQILIILLSERTGGRQEFITSTQQQRESCGITQQEKEDLLDKIKDFAQELYLETELNTTYLAIINQIKEVTNCQQLYYIKTKLE